MKHAQKINNISRYARRETDRQTDRQTDTELSMGPFYVARSNPAHQMTDLTQTNPLQMEKFGPNLTRPNTTNNGVYILVATVSGTCRVSRKNKFNCLVQPNLI